MILRSWDPRAAQGLGVLPNKLERPASDVGMTLRSLMPDWCNIEYHRYVNDYLQYIIYYLHARIAMLICYLYNKIIT